MPDLGPVTEYLGWLAGIVGFGSALYVAARRGKRKAYAIADKFGQVSDVLLGRDPIVHPETGEELVAATPGIGARMAHMERWQAEVVPILKQLADTQAALAVVANRIDRLDFNLNEHIEAHKKSR